jgi:phosphatidylserine decarboxylase
MIEFPFDVPLKHKERYKDLKTKLYVRGKFVSYTDIRIHFWHALAKVYDADGNKVLSFVELQTMLNSLGSSLVDATIENFFVRYNKNPHIDALTFDEVVECLEQRLMVEDRTAKPSDGEEPDTEHLIYLKECPICHRPNLATLRESEVVTHVALCASTDARNIDKFLVGDFVTESQAQRKWLAKLIAKVSYGGYKIGAVSVLTLYHIISCI